MPKEGKNISGNINTPPGSAIHVGEEKMETTKIFYTKYDSKEIERKKIEEIDEFIHDEQEGKVQWLNVIGLQDTDLIQKLCESLVIHQLVIEDFLNFRISVKYLDCSD